MSETEPAAAAAGGGAAPMAASVAAASPVAPDYDSIVMQWFNTFVENSPVSRSVGAINHLSQFAIPALISKLKGA